jgi:electron transport complex protein RnfD
MQFRLTPSPFQRGNRTTKGIMLELSAVLLVVWLYSVGFYFINVGLDYGVRAILVMLSALFATQLVDIIAAYIYKKRTLKEIYQYTLTSYSYVTALILALTVPVGISYFGIAMGAVFATVVGKLIFGGFGYNIVNPAVVGRIFITVSFALIYPRVAGLYDLAAGATATSTINWFTGTFSNVFTLQQLFLGNYVGALGETSTLLLILAGAYLVFREIADWRPMLAYYIGVFIITVPLGFLFGVNNPLTYGLLNISVGSLAFGAVFMITDPVSGPTSPFAKIIYGLGAATLTILIRINGAYPEGVIFSIALMNLLVPLIDSSIKGKTTDNLAKRYALLAGMVVFAVLLNYGIAILGGRI